MRHEFGRPGGDERRIEVLAQDLLCFDGAQLAVDITLRTALCATGEPQPGAAEVCGAVLVRARRDKEHEYLELVTTRRCRLVVVAMRQGAAGVTQERISCGNWRRRRHVRRRHSCSTRPHWLGNTRMVGTACAVSFLQSLVKPSESLTWCHTGGDVPSLASLLSHDPR